VGHLVAFCQLRTVQKWIRSKKKNVKDVKKYYTANISSEAHDNNTAINQIKH